MAAQPTRRVPDTPHMGPPVEKGIPQKWNTEAGSQKVQSPGPRKLKAEVKSMCRGVIPGESSPASPPAGSGTLASPLRSVDLGFSAL